MPERIVPPVVTAMLVADQVIVDAATGKKTLVGVYTRMTSRKVPFMARLSIYAQLTDAVGEYVFRVEVVHLAENRVIAGIKFGPVNSPSKLDPMEICLQLPVKLPQYGTYEFRLCLDDGTLVATRAFSLREAPPRSGHRSEEEN